MVVDNLSSTDEAFPVLRLFDRGSQQTASLILGVNGDGKKDFVIPDRKASTSVIWFELLDS